MMALGDVERLEEPVPAAPILRRLGLGVPLRSLTLLSAAEYATIQPLLAAAGVTPREPAIIAPPKMSRKRLFKALQRVVDACHGHDADPSASLLPLTVLWNVTSGRSPPLTVTLQSHSTSGPTLSRSFSGTARRTADRAMRSYPGGCAIAGCGRSSAAANFGKSTVPASTGGRARIPVP